MDIRPSLYILGNFLMFLALTLLFPIPFSLFYQDGTWPIFLIVSGLTIITGVLMRVIFKSEKTLGSKDGFFIVTFSWILLSIFGALPYVMTGSTLSFIDAFFETMSGFTTTGSTIFSNIEGLPKAILFWRAETQWLGGMGIIVLTIAILPFLGIGGMQLYKAEVPGVSKDRLSPRIQDTAKTLWVVYFIFTLAEFVLLMVFGMGFFDSLCHSFTTMATGGFSTYDSSVAAFNSSSIHIIITIFMFLAGINFTLHYRALRGDIKTYFLSAEFRLYLIMTIVAVALFTLFNSNRVPGNLLINLRDSAFQVVSIFTSTGFASADYENWHVFLQYSLILLMVVGGCAGSTGGGAKVIRVLIATKHGLYQLFKINHPKAVVSLKVDKKTLSDNVIGSVLGFFAIYLMVFITASVILTLFGIDIITSSTAVISCLSNIGPGLGSVGPTDNFGHFPQVVKIILSICMLIGRLEMFTVIVILMPSFWKN